MKKFIKDKIITFSVLVKSQGINWLLLPLVHCLFIKIKKRQSKFKNKIHFFLMKKLLEKKRKSKVRKISKEK